MALDQEELIKITNWSIKHDQTLNDLFEQFKEDTGNTKMAFVEFCHGMYYECKQD